MEQTPVLALAGYSGAGKTTLLEALLPELSRLGLRTAVVKHDGHDFEMDHVGTDSWRFTQAGAVQSILSSASQTAMVERRSLTLPEVLGLAREVDLILVEGYKNVPLSQVGLCRKASGKPFPAGFDRYVALVTDCPVPALPIPVFAYDETAALAAWIAENRRRFTAFCRETGCLHPAPR